MRKSKAGLHAKELHGIKSIDDLVKVDLANDMQLPVLTSASSCFHSNSS